LASNALLKDHSRIGCERLRSKTMPATDAAALIASGATVGMSGFTGSGYPKLVPMALAARIQAAHKAGNPFRLRVWTGASTGPELVARSPAPMALNYVCHTIQTRSPARKSIAARWNISTCI